MPEPAETGLVTGRHRWRGRGCIELAEMTPATLAGAELATAGPCQSAKPLYFKMPDLILFFVF